MVKDELFEMTVLVGGKPVVEHPPRPTGDEDGWIETDFFSPHAFQMEFNEVNHHGECFTQKWPVTPYALRLSNESSETVFCKVWIDGEYALGKTIQAHEARVCSGFQARPGFGSSEERQLLFAPPRPRAKHEAADGSVDCKLAMELSSIRVEFYPCVIEKREAKRARHGPGASFDTSVNGMNKKTAEKKDLGATSRSGDVIKSADAGGHATGCTHVYFADFENPIADLRIRYGQVHQLEKHGVRRKREPQEGEEKGSEDDPVVL